MQKIVRARSGSEVEISQRLCTYKFDTMLLSMTSFEWDEAKARANRVKHGIDFDDAVEVFYDPLAITEKERIVDGQMRWQTIGLALGILVLVVAHTTQIDREDEVVRTISPRRAERKELRTSTLCRHCGRYYEG